MRKFFIIVTVALLATVLVNSPVYAGRGCCSWHGGQSYCGSDGQWICSDGWESSCTCGGGYSYYLPTPTPTPLPNKLNIQAAYTLDASTCQYSISASWEAPSLISQYSVSLVRTAATRCIDPGSVADTRDLRQQFPNVRPGTYLVNVKPGSASGWDWYTYCTTLDVPKRTPSLTTYRTVENGEQFIKYSSTCATRIIGNNSIGTIQAPSGRVKINPKQETHYVFTATSVDGEIATSEDTIGLSTPTPEVTDTPTPLPTPVPKPPVQKGFWGQFLDLLFGNN